MSCAEYRTAVAETTLAAYRNAFTGGLPNIRTLDNLVRFATSDVLSPFAVLFPTFSDAPKLASPSLLSRDADIEASLLCAQMHLRDWLTDARKGRGFVIGGNTSLRLARRDWNCACDDWAKLCDRAGVDPWTDEVD